MTTTFACPICGAVSHDPNDAKHRYCGRCHRFVDEPVPLPEGPERRCGRPECLAWNPCPHVKP